MLHFIGVQDVQPWRFEEHMGLIKAEAACESARERGSSRERFLLLNLVFRHNGGLGRWASGRRSSAVGRVTG